MSSVNYNYYCYKCKSSDNVGKGRIVVSSSQDAIELIKTYEGFEPEVYNCPAGLPTIGYGHQLLDGENFTTISEDEAVELLNKDLESTEQSIFKLVLVELTQGQCDALCSLIYNWGSGNFAGSKGLQYLNDCKYDKAAHEFFSKENGVVFINGEFSNGLYNRRCAELDIWDS